MILAVAVQRVERDDLSYRVLNADLGVALIKLSLFFYLGSIFFSGVLPASGAIRYGSLVFAVGLSFARVTRKHVRIALLPSCAFLLVFLMYAVVNRGGVLLTGSEKSWLFTFSLTLLLSVFLRADSSHWVITIAKTIAFFAVVHAAATLYFLVFPNVYSGWFKPRFYPNVLTAKNYKAGLTSHYSTNGMYLAWGLISAYFLSKLERGSRKWILVSAFILLALLATTKRAHLLFGVTSCFAIFFLFNRGKGKLTKWFKFALILLFAVLLLYVFSLYVPALAAVLERLEGAELDDGRSSYYAICLEMWESSPFFGNGWKSFTKTLYQSGVSDLARLYLQNNLNQNAHNVYLQLLAEEGLVGIILFLIAAISGLVISAKTALAKNIENREYDSASKLAVLSVAVQIFFLLYCLTGNPLYDATTFTIYLLLGVPLLRLSD